MSPHKTTPAAQQAASDDKTTPTPTACAIQRPADPGADLTPDEEEMYALLVAIADANEEASRDRRAERRQAKPPPKSRVEFERLAVRARAIRFLADYAAGVSPSKSLKALDLSWGDVQICRFCSPDYERVYQLVRYQAGERLQDKALEAIERALDGQDIGSAAATSARFVLERLAGGNWADPRYQLLHGAKVANAGGGVAYHINLINVAQPLDPAKIGQTSPGFRPSLCGDCVAIPADDVKTA